MYMVDIRWAVELRIFCLSFLTLSLYVLETFLHYIFFEMLVLCRITKKSSLMMHVLLVSFFSGMNSQVF